jgi:hypothetical protein
MTGGPGSNGVPRTSPDEELDPLLRDPDVLAWMDEHLPEMRRSVYGQRLLYQSLVTIQVPVARGRGVGSAARQ